MVRRIRNDVETDDKGVIDGEAFLARLEAARTEVDEACPEPEETASSETKTRPVAFSRGLAERICELIAIGHPLQTICALPNMPTVTQVIKWIRRYAKFEEIYEQARILQADYLADEALVIAAEMRAQPRRFGALKAAADLLAKQAEWRAPRKYGPKMELNVAERPKTPDEIKAEIARLRDELGVPKGRIARLK